MHVCFFPSSNATALTVNNIVQKLKGVDLLNIDIILGNKTILGIPAVQLAELQSSHYSTDEQEARAKSHASISVSMHSFVQALALEVTRWFLHF